MQDINTSQPIWSKFVQNFETIIMNHDYYKKIYEFLIITQNNILLYGSYGFPTDAFIDQILKRKFIIKNGLYKQECIWKKDIPYFHNQHFLEIDLLHPNITKNLNLICEFIKSVIIIKHINNEKHCIVIKQVDILNQNDCNSFRIILEKYSANAFFICTTYKLDKIDSPIKSRFNLIRIPLFTHENISAIFKNYLLVNVNKYLVEIKTRNIIKAIFIAQIEMVDENIVTKEFCTFHFPPIYDFMKNFNSKKCCLDSIKQFSYECFQYNITIPLLFEDLLKISPKKKKSELIEIAAHYDHILNLTNKGREPIYIEAFLCNVLL